MKKITMTTSARKDMLLLFFFTLLVFIFSYYFDIFIFIVRFLERHPRHIIYVDELVMTLLSISIGFAVYSWRRWMELRRETTERMRLQEELLRIAETKAETERIISKQLHVEIEQRKQSEKNTFSAGRKNKGLFKRPS